ncbi:MAG: transcriptional regulator [Bacillota bacterium]
MNNDINNYVKTVLSYIAAEDRMKERIERDLYSHISAASEREDISIVLQRMGDPREVASEFMDNIYENKSEVIERLVQERTMVDYLYKTCYEYRSKTEIFGLPLVHIKSRRFGFKPEVAKGIIAIGDVAIGVISLGGLALGGLCFGGISLGLLTFGGVAVGALAALGGFAGAGLLAIGGMALSFGGAIGGLAVGKIAFGGLAKGIVAIGGEPVGKYVLDISEKIASKNEIHAVIKEAYPNISDWVVRLFTVFSR